MADHLVPKPVWKMSGNVPDEAVDMHNFEFFSKLPKHITPNILELCKQLSSSTPTYVTSRPLPWSKKGRCYPNVETTVEQYSGEIVYGWSLWELEGIWLFCEHHAVWKTPSGELVCVTPQLGKETKILFLEGAKPEEIGSAHYLPFEDHPLVRTAIKHQIIATDLVMEGQFYSGLRKYHDGQVVYYLKEFQARAVKRAAWKKNKKKKR